MTSDEVAREDPELVRSVVRGLTAGTAAAVADRDTAVGAVATANPDLDRDLLVEQVRLTAPLLGTGDGRSLAVDPARWSVYADWMRSEGLLSDPVEVAAAVTDRFQPEADE